MLPDSWIAKIFDHMSGLYGSKFADLWRGTDPATVRRMWAEKLAGFESMPKAIKEALDSLDDKPFPPTLPEFLGLCREAGRRHVDAPIRLEHKPTPEEKEKAEEAMKRAAAAVQQPRRDHKAWAKKLQEQDKAGAVLSLQQVVAYKEALNIADEESVDYAEAA